MARTSGGARVLLLNVKQQLCWTSLLASSRTPGTPGPPPVNHVTPTSFGDTTSYKHRVSVAISPARSGPGVLCDREDAIRNH
ncbi:hypothetical protein LSTR_LSTR002981 [Laodelphax striatellus]|uniref:Uncharacterized protein n=1 Tax=Laodelphax striatellus TaxID=195883 RepID=A0A482WRZ2_LAOST|nr:hypothetical protein LSTR_LSTR002981 [Laodelphax striatellus]